MFDQYGRGDQFSGEGLIALFDYLDELSEALGEDIKIDVIGLCCDFTEYDSLQDLIEAYLDGMDSKLVNNIDENKKDILDYFKERTQVIEVDGGSYIIENF
jgi:hypothetical protein